MTAMPQPLRPLRRDEAKRLTRLRLVAACRELLTEQAPETLTTGSIARRAGVAQATFYVHFRDMNALLSVVATEIVEQLQEALGSIRRRLHVGGDLAGMVRETFRLSLDAIQEHAGLLRLLAGEGYAGTSVLSECARGLLDDLAGQILSDIQPLVLAANLDPARMRLGADAVVALTVHSGLGLAEGRHADREQVLDLLCTMTLSLLGPWAMSAAPAPCR